VPLKLWALVKNLASPPQNGHRFNSIISRFIRHYFVPTVGATNIILNWTIATVNDRPANPRYAITRHIGHITRHLGLWKLLKKILLIRFLRVFRAPFVDDGGCFGGMFAH